LQIAFWGFMLRRERVLAMFWFWLLIVGLVLLVAWAGWRQKRYAGQDRHRGQFSETVHDPHNSGHYTKPPDWSSKPDPRRDEPWS
jgi:hypothetical protein